MRRGFRDFRGPLGRETRSQGCQRDNQRGIKRLERCTPKGPESRNRRKERRDGSEGFIRVDPNTVNFGGFTTTERLK